MEENWIDVKTPKGLILILIFLFIFTNVCIASLTYDLIVKDLSIQWKTLAIIVIGVFIFPGWVAPIFIYLRVPRRISLSDTELYFESKLGNRKTILKNQIQKVGYAKTPIRKELVYGVNYKTYVKEGVFELDKISGKLVYDWYYGNEPTAESQQAP